MKVYSLQGYPIIIENEVEGIYDFSFMNTKLTGYFSKDTILRKFKLLKNHYFYSREDIFKEYNTFENYNGIGTLGIIIDSRTQYNTNNLRLITNYPVFVGDIWQGNMITSAVSTFLYQSNRWEIELQTDEIKTLIDPSTDNNLFNESIIDSYKKGFIDALDNIKGSFNIANVGLPVQGWATPPSSVLWDANIEKMKADATEGLNDMKEKVL